MKNTLGIFFFLVLSCSTSRVVTVQPGRGGEIALHQGIFGDARAEAKKQMRANCGSKGFQVTEEGEKVVGSQTSGSARASSEKEKGGGRRSFTSNNSETRDVTEWRLKYACQGGKK